MGDLFDFGSSGPSAAEIQRIQQRARQRERERLKKEQKAAEAKAQEEAEAKLKEKERKRKAFAGQLGNDEEGQRKRYLKGK